MGSFVRVLWHLIMALQPSEDPDVKVQLIWRRTVAMTITALTMLWFGSLAWAQGWIPYAPGVATKADVDDVNRNLGAVMADIMRRQKISEVVMLRSSLKQDLKEVCMAVGAQNQIALDRANADFDVDNGRYRVLVGVDYPRAPCSVILIEPR